MSLKNKNNENSFNKQLVHNSILKITGSKVKPIVGSSGLSIQYAIVMGLIHEAKEKYNNKNIKIIFCNDNHWNELDGFHLLDYSISLLEENIVGDRGFNANDMERTSENFRNLLNEKSKIFEIVTFIFVGVAQDPLIEEFSEIMFAFKYSILLFS